eukprot:2339983-Pleurochrysis_carterae.AAC.1
MYWELKFEMRQQALKNYAKWSNFVNVAYTVLQQADLKEELDLTEEGTIPLQHCVWVNWAYGLKITHRRTISRSSWLLIKTVFEKYASLARVQE